MSLKLQSFVQDIVGSKSGAVLDAAATDMIEQYKAGARVPRLEQRIVELTAERDSLLEELTALRNAKPKQDAKPPVAPKKDG